MNNLTKNKKLILAILLQVTIIFVMAVSKLLVLNSGNDVLLRIVPVDPRDALRGDYVSFEYGISRIDSFYGYSQGSPIRNGENVYVTLKRSGKYWVEEKILKSKPANGKLFIKGRVVSGGNDEKVDFGSAYRPVNTDFHIVYGIEQYFIPEGKGSTFNFMNKEAYVRVALDKNGNAVIRQVYVNGKPWP